MRPGRSSGEVTSSEAAGQRAGPGRRAELRRRLVRNLPLNDRADDAGAPPPRYDQRHAPHPDPEREQPQPRMIGEARLRRRREPPPAPRPPASPAGRPTTRLQSRCRGGAPRPSRSSDRRRRRSPRQSGACGPPPRPPRRSAPLRGRGWRWSCRRRARAPAETRSGRGATSPRSRTIDQRRSVDARPQRRLQRLEPRRLPDLLLGRLLLRRAARVAFAGGAPEQRRLHTRLIAEDGTHAEHAHRRPRDDERDPQQQACLPHGSP